MTFEQLAKARYSVRTFKDQPIEEEKLKIVLEASLWAPTAKNIQPQRIYVLSKEEDLKKFDELSSVRYGAPVILLFTYNKDEVWTNPLEDNKVNSGEQDVSIAATHIMFEAVEQGLGTTWCGWFPVTKVAEAFNIPENEELLFVMPIGYPTDDAKPSPRHDETRDFEQLIIYK